MPRHLGSLNQATLDKMVADGDLCRLRDRLTCVKCKEARQREETEAIRARVGVSAATPQMAALFPSANGTPAKAMPPVEAVIMDTFIEYRAPDGKEWRVERGAELLKDFDILPAQIRQYIGLWHQAMAMQERVWLILRRLYGIAPMLGVQDADDMRVWTLKELGEKLGLDDDSILAMVGEAKLYFARYRNSAAKERQGVSLDNRKAMTEADVDDILSRYDLEVVGITQRRHAAKRCAELQAYLEHETGRPMAMAAIQQELLIAYVIDRRISDHQAAFEEKKKEQAARGVTGSVNDDIENKRLEALLEMRNKAVKSYEESMHKLGATQVQTGSISKRQNFQLCIGKMVEGMQRYYANADNELIDLFQTEAELVISASETDIRPPQHRPDVALGWIEAMENLWKADYEPTPVGRERSRTLRKEIAEAVKRVTKRNDDDAPASDLAAMEGAEDVPGIVAPVAAAPAGLGEAAPTPMMPLIAPRRGSGDNDVAVF